MLMKGISLIKNSPKLYLEIIQLEIIQRIGTEKPSQLIVTEELQAKYELCLEVLRAYLKVVYKNITEISFYFELITLLENFPFTEEIQNEIVTELLQNYKKDPQLWDYLAKKQYENDPSLCYAKYQEGFKHVPETAKQSLWNMILKFFIKINLGTTPSVNLQLLIQALEHANNDGFLLEEYYVTWISKVQKENEKYEIAQKGTEKYPQSVNLWKKKLVLKQNIVLHTPEADTELDQVFRLGVAALKDESLPLWDCMLNYYVNNLKNEAADMLYKEGVLQAASISNELKPKYITWLNDTKGINAARDAYNVVSTLNPYCKGLHKAMWIVESTQTNFDFDSWTKVHKLAVRQFGREDVGVWLDYLKFYMLYNKSHDSIEITENIYNMAKRNLPSHLHENFQNKFINLQDFMKNSTDVS